MRVILADNPYIAVPAKPDVNITANKPNPHFPDPVLQLEFRLINQTTTARDNQ